MCQDLACEYCEKFSCCYCGCDSCSRKSCGCAVCTACSLCVALIILIIMIPLIIALSSKGDNNTEEDPDKCHSIEFKPRYIKCNSVIFYI